MNEDPNTARLLDAMWDDFREACLPENLDKKGYDYAVLLFWAGAMSALSTIGQFSEKDPKFAETLVGRMVTELDRRLTVAVPMSVREMDS